MFRKLRTKLGLRKERSLPTNAKIGRYTYGITPDSIFNCDAKNPLIVGNFCSIAFEVVFLARGNHPTSTVSTFPLREEFIPNLEDRNNLMNQGGIIVGHDVWIGRRAIILPKVKIGNGAVIGAGAVVTKDVPPYAVVAGNPAKLIRYRFDEKAILNLQEIAWWNWSDEKIKNHVEDFFLPIDDFIERHSV